MRFWKGDARKSHIVCLSPWGVTYISGEQLHLIPIDFKIKSNLIPIVFKIKSNIILHSRSVATLFGFAGCYCQRESGGERENVRNMEWKC